jgi:hypothetical protein
VKVIYCSYWGTYAAYLTAALHVGMYDMKQIPTDNRIMQHYKICNQYETQYGNLMFVGLDEKNREVYSLGCKKYAAVIRQAHKLVNTIFHINDALIYVNIDKLEGRIPSLLSFCHRRSIMTSICPKLFNYWFKTVFDEAVEKTKEVITMLRDEER